MEIDHQSLVVWVGDEPPLQLHIVRSSNHHILSVHTLLRWMSVPPRIVFGRMSCARNI